IIITWDLPEGVTGELKDLLGGIIVNVNMATDICIVSLPEAINTLNMTISYHGTAPLLVADAPEIGKTNVRWVDKTTNESGFRLEKKLATDAGFVLLNSAASNSSSFTDNDI